MNKDNQQKPAATENVKSLDDLIQILDQDALRNVTGGARPKGQPEPSSPGDL